MDAEFADRELKSYNKARKKQFGKPKKRRFRPMDDVHLFNPENVPKTEVMLGAYGSVEWIDAQMRRDRWFARKQTLETNSTWLTPAGFDLGEWMADGEFKHFTFFSAMHVVIPFEGGHIGIMASKSKIDVSLAGEVAFCRAFERWFAARFKRAENLIRWVYNSRGEDISVPLNYRPAIVSAYPWIKQPIGEYIRNYLDSEACVLILIGPPGTGKTTLIKNIIHQSGGNARVAYDEKVLEGDDFFAAFIDGEDDVLVMEDADNFLADRQDGNTMMHKFLNVSDGLISTVGKKMIFSTNLPNITDIDPALMRTGRCFDVLQFRTLTRTEAQAVLTETGNTEPLRDGQEFTLAEIFSTQPSADSAPRRGMGFAV